MQRIELVRGVYYDSVTLMLTARELNSLPGVESSSLSMGTEANLRIMAGGGFDLSGVAATPADLIIGLSGGSAERLEHAVNMARKWLADPPWKVSSGTAEYMPRSLDGALTIMADANLAIVSVAGRYAADLAADCLERGLNVMLFSDNVPLEREIDLKAAAAQKGLLMMGPDCGTAIIRGTALGMANDCPVGPVGIVAAAGTGLQEVHTQLARRRVGTLHGIGTGGRDVKAEVGGIMTLAAAQLLAEDDEISVILIVGKPPAPEEAPLYRCSNLEESAAVAAALALGQDAAAAALTLRREIERETALAVKAIGRRRGCLRGLYSGGTLCYEAQLAATRTLGPIWSNAPLSRETLLADSLVSRGNTIVDYGEDEFTQGRLHPMIDPAFRASKIVAEAADEECAVILLNVVLGYGCHADPSAAVADAVKEAKRLSGERIAFVASVCGSPDDPQDLSEQRRKLEQAGVWLCSSNARAAALAAALIEN